MNPKSDSLTPPPGWWRRSLGMRCREASMLISEAMDRQLTWSERLFVGSHISICRWCKHYRNQTTAIRRWVECWASESPDWESPRLSQEARDRIARELGPQ